MTPEEKAQVKVLVGRVVQLVCEGVTGMDLLEVFLRRRIQPLQARDHPMWLYSGLEDTTRIHPEEVTDKMLEGWLSSITGNKDNPQGARRIPPLDQSYEVDKVQFCISNCDPVFFTLFAQNQSTDFCLVCYLLGHY